MSGWTIVDVCTLVWLWSHFIGFGDTGAATPNSPALTATSAPVAS
ncbi:hypothetical protein [Kitasatospora purpeofusca]|nr:hypothetical protein [Kitasatospora purpeofusca]MDY0810715.1 hypothetical protein [Kitasatospora purpeofusca]